MYNYFWVHEDPVVQLRNELYDVLAVIEVSFQQGRQQTIAFTGRLLQDPDTAFKRVKERFARYGYTPLLRKQDGFDVILAVKGLVRPSRSNPMINLVLLGLTILTTLFAGAMLVGVNPLRNPAGLLAGFPFAAALLGILGVHELGHYVAARLHGVEVTLPYFIPVPFGLGTFGAFIQMRSPVTDRKALLDVGIAGPLAGFLVAVPVLIVGLLLSPIRPLPPGETVLGTSLLIEFLVNLVRPHPEGFRVVLHPMALAAYFGLLVTGLNLLPVGQLDGGHIAYALLGEGARPVALATLVGLLVMGTVFWSGWYTWAFLILITGLNHPPPLNDVSSLDESRRILGWLTMGLFFLLITPKPF